MRRRSALGIARQLVERTLARTGNVLVRADHNSPVPDTERLDPGFWTTPRSMVGVDLAVDDALELLSGPLAPYLSEFVRPADRDGYAFATSSYPILDAEVLYAIVRWLKPSRVVELGSGASSHFIQQAAHRNATEGNPLEHRIYDPYPFTASPLGALEGPIVTATRAEDLDPERIAGLLGERDVLFIDTTHTLKTGGDVDRIFSAIVPRLAAGVWVHVHDVFLPYEYPREWIVDQRRLWAEQYLLHAFLAFNDAFRVRFAAMAVSRAAPETIAALVPGFSLAYTPGAFWIERVNAASYDGGAGGRKPGSRT